MLISRYFLYFIMFSFLGWVYETIFCTIKTRQWAARGFLFGPVCPIYGAGSVIIIAIVEFLLPSLNHDYTWWEIFLISFFGSIVLEYSTHFLLEKLFHAYWWDYSNMPLNIKGRVCFPASCGFGAAGVLIVYVLAPFAMTLVGHLNLLVTEFLGMLLSAVIAADCALTVAALTDFENKLAAMEHGINEHMEQYVNNLNDSIRENKDRLESQLQAERDKFTAYSAEHLSTAIGSVTRGAMSRVKSYRLPSREHGRLQLMQHIRAAKEKVAEKVTKVK